MLNILIQALGTGGDIDPMVGIGREFKSRGHKVTLLSNDYFKQHITDSGLEFVSIGTVEQYHKGNSVEAWHKDNGSDNFELYYTPAFEPAFNYIKAIANVRGTVLITLDEANGAAAAARQFNIPFIRIALSANVFFSAISPPAPQCWTITKKLPSFIIRILLRAYRKHSFQMFYESTSTAEYIATRERLGCPLTFQTKSAALLQIAMFPEWYAMRPKDWPANVKLTGFPLANRPNQSLQKEMDLLLKDLGSPIVFTAGSGIKDVTEIFREGRKICETLQIPGLFVGGNIGKEVLEGSNLCVHMNYIDFEYALPKARAILHHGGVGTMAQAIKAGIPQLIRPFKYDQPDNGNRVAKLGLGAYVLQESFNAETVAPILSSLLDQAQNNHALKKYSAEVRESKAIADACTLIEQALENAG